MDGFTLLLCHVGAGINAQCLGKRYEVGLSLVCTLADTAVPVRRIWLATRQRRRRPICGPSRMPICVRNRTEISESFLQADVASIPRATIMNVSRGLFSSLIVLLLASAVGCAGTATKESTGEYFDDTWITTRVKLALVNDSLVKATEVNVETFKGVVQLSGFVKSERAMAQAVALAGKVKGVESVENDIHVK